MTDPPETSVAPAAAEAARADSDSAAAEPTTPPNDYVSLRLCDLKRGTVLKTPILDPRGVLLLNAGQLISDTFHARLVARGMVSVMVHSEDLGDAVATTASTEQGLAEQAPQKLKGVVAAASNQTSEALDRIAVSGRGLDLPQQGEAFANEQIDRAGELHDPALRRSIMERMNDAVAIAFEIQTRIAEGRGVDEEGLNGLADAALADLAEDRDLFTCLALSPRGGNWVTRHGVHASRLGAALGAAMGLDRPTLRELVIGILVHDAGMLRIDPALYETPGPLGSAAYLEITKHPVLVFEALQHARGLPARSAFIAYQIHERCDGSGYPRRRTSQQMHALAKIAAVADEFVALSAARSYREALTPHHAVRHILKDAGAGALDS
ncbi:MAG: HD domain-containing phosphohydrolase, partial [Planctomycetota bacterium]